MGAGPAGLTAGITLARYGIGVVVIDRRDGIPALYHAVPCLLGVLLLLH